MFCPEVSLSRLKCSRCIFQADPLYSRASHEVREREERENESKLFMVSGTQKRFILFFAGLVSFFSGKHPKSWVRYERAVCSNVEDSPVVSQSTPLALIDLLDNWISPCNLSNSKGLGQCFLHEALCCGFLAGGSTRQRAENGSVVSVSVT